ncbi:MAG: YcxB family protein [Lachnospiraceae bacterium]
MKKEIQIEAEVTANDMFRFLLYHNYCRFSGLLSIVFSCACFILAIVTLGEVKITGTVALLVIGGLFSFYQPFALYQKAKKQVRKNASLRERLTYVFDEDKITIKLQDTEAVLGWDDVTKVVGLRKNILIYNGPVRANVIPRKGIEEEARQILELARSKKSPYFVKGR